MTAQALARKWRPKNFATLVGQNHVVRALTHALQTQRLHHAYLFTGTRGVGKTTIARILAKSVNCLAGVTAEPCGVCSACIDIDRGRFLDLLEVDAATNTRVDEMRTLLENAQYVPTAGRYKVYVIDEVHMLSTSAFNAMLKTLEEPPPHVLFILATTDPQKIPVTVLSRCLQFSLKALPPAMIAEHLATVLQAEAIPFEPAALLGLARAAQGSMRDALSLTDQAIAYSGAELTEKVVRDMLGTVDQNASLAVLSALAAQDAMTLFAHADELMARGISPSVLLQTLAETIYRLSLLEMVPEVLAEDPDEAALRALAGAFSAEDLQVLYSIAIHGRAELSLAPDEAVGLRMTLLRMLAFTPVGLVDETSAPAATPARQPASQLPQPRPVISPAAAEAVPRSRPSPASVQQATGKVETEAYMTSTSAAPPRAWPTVEEWPAFAATLPATGLVKQALQHSEWLGVEGQAADGDSRLVTLRVAVRAYTEPAIVMKLQQLLVDALGRPLKLKVTLGDVSQTAHVAQTAKAAAHQAEAEEALANDPVAQALVREFSAQWVPGSIKPVTDGDAGAQAGEGR